MQKFLVVAAVALLATTLAFPVVEDSWDVEDELLQRVFEDSTPLTLMQGNTKTIKHAKGEADKNEAISKEAAADEEKYHAEEAKTSKAAKALNKKQRALERADAKAEAKATKDMGDFVNKAAEESIAAEKATAAAEKANAEATKKYSEEQKALKKEGKKAGRVTKARLAKYAAEMKKSAADIKAGQDAGKKAASDLADNEKQLKESKDDIEKTFAATTAKNEKAFKGEEKKLAEEETAEQGKFAKAFKGNKAKAIAAEAAIAAEEKQNDKVEAEDKARIESVYDAKEKAQDKVEAADKKEDEDNASAEDARHTKESKKIADNLARDQEENDESDAVAATMKKKAEQADNEYKAALIKSKELAEQQKKAEDAEDHTDEEMKGCNEYTQCEEDSEDGATSKCFDVLNVPAGYTAAQGATHYMAKDLIGCTMKKSEAADMSEDAHEGEAWTGLPAPPAPPAKPLPTKACLAKRAAVKAMFGGLTAELESKTMCPFEAIACKKGLTRVQAKKALLAAYDAAAICPEWCMPNSMRADKYGIGAAETCMTAATVGMMKKQIEDMPKYEDIGTNGRFKAGPKADVCRMTKNFVKGWMAAGSDVELMQADPSTIKHAEDAKIANGEKAAASSKIEAEWTKKEKKFTDKAAELRKKDVALQKKAAKDNAEAAKKMADDAADAATKVIGANKATAKAEAANKKMQAKYAAEQAKIKASGKEADKATKKRMKKYKKEMAANAKAIKAGKAAAEKAAQDEKDNNAKNKKDLAGIAAKFHAKKEALAKKSAKEEKKMSAEKKAMEAKYDAEDAKNMSDTKKAALAIEKERVMNGVKAAAEQAKINAIHSAIAAAHAKKDKLWHEAAAAKAKALAATREATRKKFADKAAKIEKEYQHHKATVIKALHDKAAAADKKEKDYSAKMAKEQGEMDKDEDAEDHTDEEMKGCAQDGTECELDSADGSTMKCFPVKNMPAGQEAVTGAEWYLAKDQVSCTKDAKDAATDDAYTGNDWTGLKKAPKAAAVKPSAECKALRKAFYAKGSIGENHKTAESIACAKDLSAKAAKDGLEAYWEMGSKCPTTCDEGSGVHTKEVDGDDTVNKICITSADIGMMKDQIEDMPNYKDMGTNNRFKAGPPADVCRMVKNTMAGWAAGKKLE